MNKEFFDKILKDHQELSSLPQTLSEVLRVTKDENSATSDLSNVISHDPALTAKILRIVNSPYYGSAREITTLTQAVITLGTRTVTALALSTSIYDVTGKWNNSIDRISFWRHSLETAIAARLIAESINYPYPEEAFISGLLHDIGLLVLEKSFPDKFNSLWRQAESGDHFNELEENHWGTNHARVGQFLLEQWNIPAVISDAVGQHHNIFPPDIDDKDFHLPQIICLANKISKMKIAKTSIPVMEEYTCKDNILNNLNIPEENIRKIEKNLFAITVEEARFLEIDIGSPDDILMEANRLLFNQYLNVENLLRENTQMQKEIVKTKMEKSALESVKTITATFSHYINNAVATIMGRAQLIEVAVERGDVIDPQNKIPYAVDIIIKSINSIEVVLDELKKLNAFETTVYHDDTYIIDIENKLKEKLNSLDIKKNQPKPVG